MLKAVLREHMMLHLDRKAKNPRVMTNAHHAVHVSSYEALLMLIILILSFPQFRGYYLYPKELPIFSHVFPCYQQVELLSWTTIA